MYVCVCVCVCLYFPCSGQSARIFISTTDGDATTSLTVRPWFDLLTDLEAQAFASDTPSQRQQLLLDGKRLKDDGSVLALQGVVPQCTIQLVSIGKPLLIASV